MKKSANNKLKKLKNSLEKERLELISKLKEMEFPDEFGSDHGDVDEEAAETQSYSLKISESQLLRNRINEIDYLINKINSGTYGFCNRCKKQIPGKKLLINPESIFCPNCEKNKKNKK